MCADALPPPPSAQAELGGMPRSKMQIKVPRLGVFMKDTHSLAHYNVDASSTLELTLRTRGRRK